VTVGVTSQTVTSQTAASPFAVYVARRRQETGTRKVGVASLRVTTIEACSGATDNRVDRNVFALAMRK
jgi:hypothetical protein